MLDRVLSPAGRAGSSACSATRAEPRRVLEEAKTEQKSGGSTESGSNSYAEFDITKILKDEDDGVQEFKRDPSQPYSLGPKISDWISRELNGLKGIRVFPILLLRTSLGVHGIEIFYNMALLDAEMAGFWAKLPLIRKLLLSHPEVEFLWWMDSDAMFTDMAYEVPWERYKDHNFVMHGWNEMVYDQKNWIGLNTGVSC
ncbi:UNVERIFIED_CONTAM: Xyloglucan 6-xylosyltransferase 2 [Sesamum latifolium]|uniref:Xyloglucan 6-xylosyltransferase 2 n=1 Tax=Sesamum latifolium TaxID=2727402 RepID=A0AAW2XV01_9LAMI